MNDVSVHENKYHCHAGDLLGMDIYYPPNVSDTNTILPAVVLVTGHADPKMKAAVGCVLKDSEQYKSWAKLLAASGLIAITYENRQPEEDAIAALDFVTQNADSLRIIPSALGVWACSANVPNALAITMTERYDICCAAYLYGYMLDLGKNTFVADAASQSGFAAPNHNRSVDDIPAGIALLLVRAGADQFEGLNQSIDDFTAAALERNLPVTLTNLPNAPHSFDILDDTDQSRSAIRDVITFLTFHLQRRSAML